MSYFGYPIAHEDDAVLATQRGAPNRRGRQGRQPGHRQAPRRPKFTPRGASHRRRGRRRGRPRGNQDWLAVGEAVNLAARIQRLRSSTPWSFPPRRRKLIEGYFELHSLDARILRGFTRPVELFRVVRPTGARTKFEATARGRLTPTWGARWRSEEMAVAWREVQAGADRALVVRGEAGIGKSRIVHHFRHDEVGRGAAVLECFCSPLTQATAFAPIVEMLDARVADYARGESAPQRQARSAGRPAR